MTGTFSGTFAETVTGTTDLDGTVTFTTSNATRGGVTVNFCIDNVTHPSLAYDAGLNDVTCTGSGARTASKSPAEAILEENFEYSLSIYPNPVVRNLKVDLLAEEQGTLELMIINLNGQAVRKINQEVAKGENSLRLDMHQLPHEIYYIIGKYFNKSFRQKFMKNSGE